MREKPGPESTWTRPPSWSVATSSGTPPVAVRETVACSAALTFAVAFTPRELRPVSMTLPTW